MHQVSYEVTITHEDYQILTKALKLKDLTGFADRIKLIIYVHPGIVEDDIAAQGAKIALNLNPLKKEGVD